MLKVASQTLFLLVCEEALDLHDDGDVESMSDDGSQEPSPPMVAVDNT